MTPMPILMITAFLLLRKAMRKVTSLPDEYLDEREISNRDWAFKLGYLVVRRIGLALTATLLTGSFAIWIARVAITYDNYNRSDSPVYKAEQWLQDYVEALLKPGAIQFGFSMFFLLTFVAYSFPLILLAWRESKFTTSTPSLAQTTLTSIFAANVRRYFWQLLFAGLGWLIVFSLQVWTRYTILPIYFLLAFTIYVHIWGIVKISSALVELPGPRSRPLFWLHVVTSVCGALVPIILFTPLLHVFGFTFLYLGFALIPLQVASFVVLHKAVKTMNAD